jgi:3-oxoadipate enol-lactonase
MWEHVTPALAAAGYRVVAVDLPGHGAAAKPSAPGAAWSVEDLAAGAAGALDAAGVGPAALVGFSLGGAVALALALAAPARAAALVLADTSAWMGPGAPALFGDRAVLVEARGVEALVEPAIGRWFTPEFAAARPDVVARCAARLRENDPAGYAAACRSLATLDLRGRLGEVRCPALVLVGDRDQATPLAMARGLEAGIPGARLEVLGPSGHLVTEECPDPFAGALLAFLAARYPAGPGPRPA